MKFFILFLLLPCAIIAQGPGGGYRNYRVVGADTGPNPYVGGSQMNSFTGIETISAFSSSRFIRGTAANAASKNGKLLFYTNGYSVCDKYGNVVPNGDSLTPTPRAYNDFNSGNNFLQNSFIFQHKADSSLYTMIHTGLNDYSIANGPLAAWISEFKINADSTVSVIKKNQVLINDTIETSGITGCKHGNGRDWWVLIKNQFTNKYHTLLFTPDSIYEYLNSTAGAPTFMNGSSMVFSPDGKYYATYDNTTGMYIYSFNRCTGLLTLLATFADPANGSHLGAGLVFSPNSQYLYFDNLLHIWRIPMQSNLTTANIELVKDNYLFLDTTIPAAGNYYHAELSNDGRIYIGGTASFHYYCTIANPDAPLVANVGYAHWDQFELPYYNNQSFTNHAFYTLGADIGCPCDTLALGVGEPPGLTQREEINIFPNPTNGNFSISFNEQAISGMLYIYDTNGKLVVEEYIAPWSNVKNINVQGVLPSGMYAVSIAFGKNRAFGKFVVK